MVTMTTNLVKMMRMNDDDGDDDVLPIAHSLEM